MRSRALGTPHPDCHRRCAGRREDTAMPLVDIAQQTPGTPDKGPTCTACQLDASLPPEEGEALRQMLADPRWRYSALEEVLRTEGYLVGAHTLARHARGLCGGRVKLR